MHYFIIGNSQPIAAEFSLFGLSSFPDLVTTETKSVRHKFGLRIFLFLDPVFVARSSSVLSWVLD